jgi:hypothetical protein
VQIRGNRQLGGRVKIVPNCAEKDLHYKQEKYGSRVLPRVKSRKNKLDQSIQVIHCGFNFASGARNELKQAARHRANPNQKPAKRILRVEEKQSYNL